MRRTHKFRPSGQWALEDRVALSHASPVAEISSSAATAVRGLRASFQGRYNATPPVMPGGETQANLAGTSRMAGLGNIRLVGSLFSNPSLPPSPTNTHGTVNLTSRQAGGLITVEVTGPSVDLASRTRTAAQLHYRVLSAPSPLASWIGTEGTATLTLRPRGRRLATEGIVQGQFTLRVVQS